MRTFYKTELEPLVLFVASIFVFYPLMILGIVWNFGKSIKECIQIKFWIGIWKFILFWLKILYQFWCSVKYYLYQLAITNDYMGNAFGGEMFEDCVSTEEKTWYGNGQITVSAATGDLESRTKLNKFGIKFANLLSNVLGKHHCKEAYISELNKK